MQVRPALAATAAALLALAGCQTNPPPPMPMPPTASPAAITPAAAPAPAWQQGRSPEQARSTLAPLPGKLTGTAAADIPLANYKLSPGLRG